MLGPFQWRHKFRAGCSRWTIPREMILKLLSRSPEHLSAKEIYAAVYPFYPGIGLTTIYRTLDLLRRLGLVHRISGADGQGCYELKKVNGKDDHHHLICTECGRIVDGRDSFKEGLAILRKMAEALAKKHGFLITDQNIEFYGLCEHCQKASSR